VRGSALARAEPLAQAGIQACSMAWLPPKPTDLVPR
jgi:hypothetical protein